MHNFLYFREHYLNLPFEAFSALIEESTRSGVPENGYLRIPFDTRNCVVLLMIWGKNSGTAIHGHAGFGGAVKVLKGLVKEDTYEFREKDLQLVSSGTFSPEAILIEDTNTIHAISNQAKEYSVTLHIYDTSHNTLAGNVLYDPKDRKAGILNDKAKSATWEEDPGAFSSVVSFDLFSGK